MPRQPGSVDGMDPNETLSKIRARAADCIAILDGKEDDVSLVDAVVELAEATQALDSWIENGGFLPTDWQEGQQQ